MSKNEECVRVAMRCRPLSQKEMDENRQITVEIVSKLKQIVVFSKPNDTENQKNFTFDMVYDWNSSQTEIYKETASPIVDSVMEGFNGTIFAYGQTGTGKTHTMEGKPVPEQHRGIIPRAFEHIFSVIENSSKNRQYLVRCTFLELYNEEIRDLLSKNVERKLEIRENKDSGVFVKDLTPFMIHDMSELVKKLQIGTQNRVTGETSMNRHSSRSHSIFTVIVEMSENVEGQNRIRVGKLNLVDLAGSERQSKTHAVGERFIEAVNINQSLSTLGNVISALVDGKSTHIPYRDSKLTRLLQDSLGGNTKTVMIANIGPADFNYDETLSTLRYANRAKNIKNKPKINEDPKDAMLRQFQEEIERLKKQLADAAGAGGNVDNGQDLDGGVRKIERVEKFFNEEKLKELRNKYEQEQQKKMDTFKKEREEIEQKKQQNEIQKKKLLAELNEKEEKEKASIVQQQKLVDQIIKMEQKVIRGSAIIEAAVKKEKELTETKKQIEAEKKMEAKFKEEMIQAEEQLLDLDQKYNSQKEEVEDKTRKLKLLWQKIKQSEAENKEIDEFYSSEITELQERRRLLQKEIKMRQLIVEYFIPEKEFIKLERRAVYNENIDDWILPQMQLAGNLIRKNPEFKQEEEDEDTEKGEEIDIEEIENHPNVYFVYGEEGLIKEEEAYPKDKKNLKNKNSKKPATAKNKRPASKNENRIESAKKTNLNIKKKNNSSEESFPKAKGLVPKK